MLLLHGAIDHSNSSVSMLRYCANLKVIRYESMSSNRIVVNKSHHVIVALQNTELIYCLHFKIYVKV